MPAEAKCRSCDAPIRWVVSSTTGHGMPIDRDPVDNGNLIVVNGMATVLPQQPDLLSPPLNDQPRYVSHFSTCRDADSWRRRK